jgi:hypothetical protein
MCSSHYQTTHPMAQHHIPAALHPHCMCSSHYQTTYRNLLYICMHSYKLARNVHEWKDRIIQHMWTLISQTALFNQQIPKEVDFSTMHVSSNNNQSYQKYTLHNMHIHNNFLK